MPTVNALSIQRFRNLSQVDITISPSINFFFGDNGAGKTSLLEALHYLSTGHSFRMHLSHPLIQHGMDSFSIFATLAGNDRLIPLGVERYLDGQRQLRLDGKPISSWVALANQFPVRAVSAMSDRFLLDGPKVRRQFIDWMTFHVEPSFLSAWQTAQRLLKHRNAALKTGASKNELQIWTTPLVAAANEVDISRSKTIQAFEPYFEGLIKKLLPSFSFRLHYTRGWEMDTPLEEALLKDLQRDYQRGYTHSGCHRADLQIFVDEHPAQELLSQGQQKLLTHALHLAQGSLFKEKLNQSPVFLLDDLAAELDAEKRCETIAILHGIGAQIFITGTIKEDILPFLNSSATALFHVERGTVKSYPN